MPSLELLQVLGSQQGNGAVVNIKIRSGNYYCRQGCE